MKKLKIIILDYGLGNILSVKRALEYCDAKVIVSSNKKDILKADKVVLPGVGAFGVAIKKLKSLGLDDVIKEVNYKETPLLGICLGMQLLLSDSKEFGFNEGLNLIPGSVIPIPKNSSKINKIKIPHIGWNQIFSYKENKTGNFLKDSFVNEYFYFVHSFMAAPKNIENRYADCNYNGISIPAVIGKNNIIGCQFHPEKSGKTGLNFLHLFCNGK